MGGFDGDISTTILREKQFQEFIDELRCAIDGGDTQITSVIGVASEYQDAAAVRFVDDIVDAYNQYPIIEEITENRVSYEAYLEWHRETAERDGVPKLLDKTQELLVRSMLYCLMRIIADNPFYRYRGTFDELKHECAVLLQSFARGVGKQDFWHEDIKRYVLSNGRPHTPYSLAVDPTNPLYLEKPIIGTDGSVGWQAGHPTFFLDDLDAIYEILSGKHVAESIPIEQRRAIAADAEYFSYLKDDARAGRLNYWETAAALQQGWIDEDDAEQARANSEAATPKDEQALEWDHVDAEWIEAAEETAIWEEEEAIERWREEFPCKDRWCESYLAMRNAYFELEGIGPVVPESATREWHGVRAVNGDYLAGAIDAVLNQRGVSLFSDNAYFEACEAIQRATARARRSAMRRR